jgi:hypothetical protein
MIQSVDEHAQSAAEYEEEKRTRNLILFLVRHEVERYALWHNPGAQVLGS